MNRGKWNFILILRTMRATKEFYVDTMHVFKKITLDTVSVETRLEKLTGNMGRPVSWVMM